MASNNELDDLLKQQMVIKDRVRGIVHEKSNGMYLHGRPGTSKSYMVLTTLDTLAVNYSYSNGHLTPIGLFDLLSENRDRIIVLDDVSAIFNAPIALQLLLAALGNPHDGTRVRYVRYKTAKGDQVEPFSGGVIAISNLPLAHHHHEVLAAINDRVFVIGYEPTDEQIIALINKLADDGVKGVPPEKARPVAHFLVTECKLREIRPSVRLFVDKALVDFQLWEAGNSETHWKDLIVSNLKQQAVEPQFPTNDLSRAEQVAAERRIALGIYLEHIGRKERVEAWRERTGKGQSSLYNRLGELRKEGKLPDLHVGGAVDE
jgi:hypothetical protein